MLFRSDNFISIRAIKFSNRFKNLNFEVSNEFKSNYLLYSIAILLELELLSLFVNIVPPWRGRNRAYKIPVDEEAASAPHPRMTP